MKGPSTRSARDELVAAYGFVVWVCSFVVFGIYLAWVFLPEKTLLELGVTFAPDRYWATAVPAHFVLTVLFGWFVVVGLNFMETVSLTSISSVRDEYSRPLPPGRREALLRRVHDGHEAAGRSGNVEKGIPEISDLPLTLVNELLYLRIQR